MSNTKLFFLALVVTAFVHVLAAPATAQAVRVPGTKVHLAPPDGFLLAQQYPGFERESDSAAIMVTELPGAAADMMGVISREALAGKGMTLVSSSPHVINGRPARLLNVRQATFNGDMLKWMLIAGDQTTTIMIVGMFPADSPSETGAAIQQALLSTSWSAASPNAFEGLPFRVTPTSKLRLARRVSNMLALTESGTTGAARSPRRSTSSVIR